jgi:hypothetical protein
MPYRFQNVAIVAGGFISGIDYNPAAKDVAYVRTDIGTAYRWSASAGRWLPLLDWVSPDDWNLTGVESIGIDPSDAQRVYLAVGTYTNNWASNGAIFRSADQGRTWLRSDLPFKNGGNEDGRSAGERLDVDPNNDSILFFGSRHNGLWRSADYGATWKRVDSFPVTQYQKTNGVVCVLFDPSSGSHGHPTPVVYAFVGQSNGPAVYKSADAGQTWQPLAGQPSQGYQPHRAVMTKSGVLFVTYANGSGPNGVSRGAVWKFDTKSGAWTDISPIQTGAPGSSAYAGLAVDAENPETVMVSTLDRWNPGDTVFRSTNVGRTWEDLRPKSVRDWSLAPYMTFGGRDASFGWWIGALAIDPFRPGRAMYGTGATIWTSGDVTQADSGAATHWSIGALGIEETAVLDLISPPAGAHLFSGLGDIGGFRHDDVDVSPRMGMWKPGMDNCDHLAFAQNLPSLILRSGRGDRDADGVISTDGGTTWAPFATKPAGETAGGSIAVSPNGATIVWATNGGGVSVSRDHGASWTRCAGAPNRMSVVADGSASTKFYGLDGATVYVSTDSGASFSAAGRADGRRQ